MIRRTCSFRSLIISVLPAAGVLCLGCAAIERSEQESVASCEPAASPTEERDALREMRIDSRATFLDRGGNASSVHDLTMTDLRPALRAYRDVFKEVKIDASTGKHAVDDRGGLVYENREARIRAELAAAVDRFRKQGRQGGIDPVEFRRYLESTPAELGALDHIDAMRRFFDQLHLLGLGHAEEEECRRANLGRVCPAGLRVQQLKEVVLAEPEETLTALQ